MTSSNEEIIILSHIILFVWLISIYHIEVVRRLFSEYDPQWQNITLFWIWPSGQNMSHIIWLFSKFDPHRQNMTLFWIWPSGQNLSLFWIWPSVLPLRVRFRKRSYFAAEAQQFQKKGHILSLRLRFRKRSYFAA